MTTITTHDGVEIFYKDGAEGRTAYRLPSRMAADRRRVGHADAYFLI